MDLGTQRSFEDVKDMHGNSIGIEMSGFQPAIQLVYGRLRLWHYAVLAQDAHDEVVVAYASCLLRSSELKYIVLQKEALGIMKSLKYSIFLWPIFCCSYGPSTFEMMNYHERSKQYVLLVRSVRCDPMTLTLFAVLGDYAQMQTICQGTLRREKTVCWKSQYKISVKFKKDYSYARQ